MNTPAERAADHELAKIIYQQILEDQRAYQDRGEPRVDFNTRYLGNVRWLEAETDRDVGAVFRRHLTEMQRKHPREYRWFKLFLKRHLRDREYRFIARAHGWNDKPIKASEIPF